MIIVSDTSPLNYLLAIGHVEVLPAIFGKIIIPSSVARELAATASPELNRRWLAELPSAFEIRSATSIDAGIPLDAGEQEAISLAVELGVDALLIDEKRGRQCATARGLIVVGTIGVLEQAASMHKLDLPSALTALRRTGFHGSERLFAEALGRWRESSQ